MKIISAVMIAVAAIPSYQPSLGSSLVKSDIGLSVVSWNIAYGQSFESILNGLKRLNTDIYVLQEVDLNTRRAGFRDVAKDLASALGYHYLWTKEFQELRQDRSDGPAFTGQAILSRYPIRLVGELYFKNQTAKWTLSPFHPRSWFQPRLGGRVAQFVELTVGEKKLIICNTHLESSVPDKLIFPQMVEIKDCLSKNFPNMPIILAGDLNTKAGLNSRAVKLMTGDGFIDALSLSYKPEDRPSTQPKPALLDWIFVNSGFSVVSASVENEIGGSDHYPVLVRLALN